MTYDWLVRIATRVSGSVHYVPRDEAERIAHCCANACEGIVIEGPRALTAEERMSPKDRDGARKAAA
jgi:hypothetical protein